jgi:LysM repeat protein
MATTAETIAALKAAIAKKQAEAGGISTPSSGINQAPTDGSIGLLNTSGSTNLYNPNTGELLKAGESVVNNQTGQTVTQGTTYTPYNASNASSLVYSRIPNVFNITPQVSSGNYSYSSVASNNTGSSYVIQSGDTLSAIAQKKGTTVSALMQANPSITNPNMIYSGQSLVIPTQTSSTSSGTTGTPVQGSQSVTGATDEERRQAIAAVLAEIQRRVNEGTADFGSLQPEVQNLITQGQEAGTVNETSDASYYADLLEQNREETEKITNPTTGSTGYQALIDMINQQPGLDTAGTLAQAQEQYNIAGITEQVSAQNQVVQAIRAEIGQLEAEQSTEVENARNRLSSMESISADINEIKYQYGLKIAKKTALMASEAALAQVYQGNLNQANAMVEQAVNAYTADKQAEVEKFDNLFSVYSSWIGDLKDEERQILENAHQAAKDNLEEAKKETTQVMELKLQYAGAGINISDTLGQAISKAEKYSVQQSQIESSQIDTKIIGSADTGYNLINSKTGEIIKQITGSSSGNVVDNRRYIDDPANNRSIPNPNYGKIVSFSTKEQQSINSDASSLIAKLDAKQIGWGTAFDMMKLRHPDMTNEQIDNILNKQSRGTIERELSKDEITSGMWDWIDSNTSATEEEKKNIIRRAGLNPEDFGIY